MESLGVALARGDVAFALRANAGGDFKRQREAALDPRVSALVMFGKSNWNVDDFAPLFKFAQMNDGKYRVEQVPPLDWIYLERQTFDRFIAGMTPTTTEADLIKEPWRRIVAMKTANPLLPRKEIFAAFEMSTREFQRHWDKAAEQMPALKKAGRRGFRLNEPQS
ncbi:hypothetical protein [Rhizobium leguminosarum]|uniref:hypothetical protein n=1 Tax=Rhizobium leguminosarum TaxID=384 RepID=UPI00102FDAD8|nr:hypothetical protein [Rhizobium leguminosarum]